MNPLPNAEALYLDLLVALKAGLHRDAKLVGIYSGGAWLAERLAQDLAHRPEIGKIDVAYYRDDYKTAGLKATTRRTDIPFSVDGAHIVLVDDVLYTGRSVRAAINELFDFGRPASVGLAVLIDRGGREIPYSPDFCALQMVVATDTALVLGLNEAQQFTLHTEVRT
jgi:pyrimidine operon attenuation protein / uracil phosphoribosyltransferase